MTAWGALLLVAVPVAGALAVAATPATRARLPRAWAMAAMLVVLVLSLRSFVAFGRQGGIQADVDLAWMPSLGVDLHVGIDAFNLYLVLLSALLFPIVLASTWDEPHTKRRLYLALVLVLQASLIGTFLAQNLVLFFVFWEAVLIPAGLLILVFGGTRRRQAATAFFLYTLAGSVLLLAAVIALGAECAGQTGRWSFELAVLHRLDLGWRMQLFVFVAIILACAVKCPIVPFHSWLPLAYCEAPPAVTALMAGALSKMGAFGILKLAIPLAPQVAVAAGPWMAALGVLSILYGAVLALREGDYKRLVAYSSLSHMGFIVLGLFAFQQTAVHGSLLQMLSHGVGVTGLFLLLGKLAPAGVPAPARVHGLAASAPRLAVLTMLFVLTSVALPLTSGFTAEFLILLGAFTQGLRDIDRGMSSLMLASAVLASTAMVLGATYMLRFARVVVFGGASGEQTPSPDVGLRAMAPFAALLFVVLWIGVAPASLMEKVQGATSQIADVATAQATPQMPARPALAANGDRHAR